MKKFKWWEEDAPVNATGPAVVGTGDDSSTVVVRKKVKVYRRKKRMTKKEVEEARDYRKEYDEYHAKPEQRERNAARLRARRQMVKDGKVKKFDKKDVHHKDNNPLNNDKNNLSPRIRITSVPPPARLLCPGYYAQATVPRLLCPD